MAESLDTPGAGGASHSMGVVHMKAIFNCYAWPKVNAELPSAGGRYQ
jgi:hypothetical protein